jgi:insulysin
MSSATSNQWIPVDGQHPHLRFGNSIRKSQQDDRSYRLIKLENGLEALLVSDATTDKAAASLNVGVGHLSDPVPSPVHSSLIVFLTSYRQDDMPGLAHFCEHLSFMGTEQYPRENAYSEVCH